MWSYPTAEIPQLTKNCFAKIISAPSNDIGYHDGSNRQNLLL